MLSFPTGLFLAAGARATILTRRRCLGAKHPPNRVRWVLGEGMSAARRSTNSTPLNRRRVVPSLQGRFSLMRTSPPEAGLSRSSGVEFLAMYRRSRSSAPSPGILGVSVSRLAGTEVPACNEKPLRMASRWPSLTSRALSPTLPNSPSSVRPSLRTGFPGGVERGTVMP